MAAEPDGNDPQRAFRFLQREIPNHFSLAELQDLAGEIGLDYQRVPHGTTTALTDSLLRYAANHGAQATLLARLRQEREFVAWPERYAYPSGGMEEPSPNPSQREGDQKRDNPFGHTGRLNGPPAYLVRQPFTDQVLHELRKGASLSIVGQEQTGKSSLLWYLAHHAPARLGPPVEGLYLDMQLLSDDHDFYDALGEELGIAAARGRKLERALRGRRVLLCLDEVEKMTWDGFSRDLRSQLRGLADGPDMPLSLVIASRTPLSRLFPDAPGETSPLANLCLPLEMRPFTLAEARALADAYLRGHDVALPPEAVETAWRASGGLPASLQRQLKKAYDKAGTDFTSERNSL